jgi:hypothetical protein
LSYCACCSAAPAPGGRQQPRPRRTQRRVTHNEKRYHSGTPLSIPRVLLLYSTDLSLEHLEAFITYL